MRTAAAKPGNKKGLMIGLIAGGGLLLIAVIVVILVAVLGGGSHSPEKAAETVISSIYDGNGKKALDCFPKEMVNYYCDRRGVSRSYLESMITTSGQLFSAVSNVTVMEVEAIATDDISADQVARNNENYKSMGFQVSEMKNVRVQVTYRYSLWGITDTDTTSAWILVGKIGGSWYVLEEDLLRNPF